MCIRDRIGGEVSSSIFLSFSNKQHYGFIGDSYVGSFVNLGAGTTTSNLKNNYSVVKVRIGRKEIETGKIFIGSFIGDYVRTGIGTNLNTGTVIGIGSQIIGRKGEKYIPPFIFEKGKYFEYEIEKEFATIKVMKKRRGVEFWDEERRILLKIFKETKDERKNFIKE